MKREMEVKCQGLVGAVTLMYGLIDQIAWLSVLLFLIGGIIMNNAFNKWNVVVLAKQEENSDGA